MFTQPFVASGSAAARALDAFAGDVEYYLGLNPRQLPSRYFYDALGSALFDAICALPWYPITRADRRLLAAPGAGLRACLDALTTIGELGPGGGEKLATLLAARRSALP